MLYQLIFFYIPGSTPSPELMKADSESIEDNSLNGIIVIDGENFLIGQGSTDIIGHVATDLDTGTVGGSHFDGHSNSMGLSNVASMVQIVTANNQSVEPPEGKVPISRMNSESASPEGIIVTPTVPSRQPYVLSKPMALDFSGTNLLTSQGLIGQNLLLQLQNEGSVSNGANLPVSKLQTIPIIWQPICPDSFSRLAELLQSCTVCHPLAHHAL
jgi:hypothetical protein